MNTSRNRSTSIAAGRWGDAATAHAQRIRRALRGRAREAGMSTAEYAVGTIAACAFAAVLYKVVTSGPVSEALQRLVERALDATF